MLYSTARLHSAMPTGNTRIPLVGTHCYKGQIVGTNGVRYRGVPARLSHAENFTTLRKEFLFRLSQIKCPHFQENVFQRVVCVFIWCSKLIDHIAATTHACREFHKLLLSFKSLTLLVIKGMGRISTNCCETILVYIVSEPDPHVRVWFRD